MFSLTIEVVTLCVSFGFAIPNPAHTSSKEAPPTTTDAPSPTPEKKTSSAGKKAPPKKSDTLPVKKDALPNTKALLKPPKQKKPAPLSKEEREILANLELLLLLDLLNDYDLFEEDPE